jgi:hypothetical protein
MQPPSRLISQPELLPSSGDLPADFFSSHEICGEFTAERLYKQRPEIYRVVVTLLAERMGLIKIGAICNVSAHTVAAVRDREGISVAIEKERIAETCARGASMAFEAVVEDLACEHKRAKIPALQKAMIGGIMTEKALLLRGEATMIIEVQEIAEPDHNAFQRYIDGLQSTGCGGGNPAQKSGAETTAADGLERLNPPAGPTPPN